MFFSNRIKKGGYWRQNNVDYENGNGQPQYWMQKWQYGPAREVVLVDALQVENDGKCTQLLHIVYTYYPKTRFINSSAFGGNGLSGKGITQYLGTITNSETTLTLPNDLGEIKMNDIADQDLDPHIEVQANTWDGKQWTAGKK